MQSLFRQHFISADHMDTVPELQKNKPNYQWKCQPNIRINKHSQLKTSNHCTTIFIKVTNNKIIDLNTDWLECLWCDHFSIIWSSNIVITFFFLNYFHLSSFFWEALIRIIYLQIMMFGIMHNTVPVKNTQDKKPFWHAGQGISRFLV